MNKYWPEEEVFLAGRRSLGRKVPSEKLLAYLEKFQNDELTTGTVDRPARFAVQREKLVAAMRKKYPEYGLRQVIRGSKMDVDVQNFWELVFAMHFITREIEITANIGFDKLQIAAGLRTTRKIPHAEFKIVDERLRNSIMRPAYTGAAETKQRVSIIAGENSEIFARLADGTNYWIANLRVDDKPYQFLQYLLSHPDSILTSTILETEAKIDAKYGLTELIRQLGFTNDLLPLKPIFFPAISKNKRRFMQTVELDAAHIALLAGRDANRTKSKRAKTSPL